MNNSKQTFTVLGLKTFALSLLMMTGGAQIAYAQSNTSYKGKIVDATGDPIIGATVKVKGTSNGVATDLNGNFSIEGASGAILEISYVGMKSQEVKPHSGNVATITMKEDSKVMDEVVVVGYGTQKKANLTGSVASVTSKDLKDIPAANATNLLQGRLPGVTLTSNGGLAGGDTPEIRIRGIGTFGNNDPMVLIDGVEASVSQIQQIAPADIDNVSVLKDAASAAIYGVRAANGVILITTKRGFASKPSINYSGSYTIQKAAILPDYVDGYNWAKMYNESNNREVYTADMLKKIQDGSDPDHFANTNWNDAIFRTAPMTQHNLSVSGGTKDVNYMTSIGYLNQDGVLKNTGYERFNPHCSSLW